MYVVFDPWLVLSVNTPTQSYLNKRNCFKIWRPDRKAVRRFKESLYYAAFNRYQITPRTR